MCVSRKVRHQKEQLPCLWKHLFLMSHGFLTSCATCTLDVSPYSPLFSASISNMEPSPFIAGVKYCLVKTPAYKKSHSEQLLNQQLALVLTYCVLSYLHELTPVTDSLGGQDLVCILRCSVHGFHYILKYLLRYPLAR